MDKVLFPHKFAYVLSALTLPQASSVINRQLQARAPPRVPLSLGLGCCWVLSVSVLFICFFAFFSLLQSYFSLNLPVPLLLSVYHTVLFSFSFPSSTLRVNLDPSKRQSSNKSVSGCTLPQGSKTVSKFSSCLWPCSISQSVKNTHSLTTFFGTRVGAGCQSTSLSFES